MKINSNYELWRGMKKNNELIQLLKQTQEINKYCEKTKRDAVIWGVVVVTISIIAIILALLMN